MSSPDFSRNLAASTAAQAEAVLGTFRVTVLDHYRAHGRDLPWRRTHDPYRILVSEVMLQQTQVSRVVGKYERFLAAFPDVQSLSAAPVGAVLTTWQGLGYNRRALALLRTARVIVSEHQGAVPRSLPELRSLPGVGPATAAAVGVFAFGLPIPFVETNIRSAFIHFFFQEGVAIPDADILPLVQLTLDRKNPRDWYYALMDYGAWVKRNYPNPSRRSKHHTSQSAFVGSHRQLRAQILRALIDATAEAPRREGDASAADAEGSDAAEVWAQHPDRDPEEISAALRQLLDEGFLRCREGRYLVP